ncbi:universal stress protein (plasmid) [Haloferacaceae archaeon DSL9]
MQRALAVVSGTKTDERLLSEAGTIAAGTQAELLVMHIVDANKYEGEVQRKASSGRQPKSLEDITEAAKRTAEDAADSALREMDVDYQAIGLVGNLPEAITTEAENRGCDHIFIVGRRRSPTGKAVFGDIAQSVILNFDGPVTVLIEDK